MRRFVASLVRVEECSLKPRRRLAGFRFRPTTCSPCRSLAQVQSSREIFPDIWFTSSSPPRRAPQQPGTKPEDASSEERTLKLGKSTSHWASFRSNQNNDLVLAKALRILQSRLPTLLASPLPPDILSPHITLHLFPSTHPHLPTVSGRVAYHGSYISE